MQEPYLWGTAHEYVWLDRAPLPLPSAATSGAVAAPDAGLRGEEGTAGDAVLDVNPRWAMEENPKLMVVSFKVTRAVPIICPKQSKGASVAAEPQGAAAGVATHQGRRPARPWCHSLRL
jgi:hypothetical protein